jgi:hypothetical protein
METNSDKTISDFNDAGKVSKWAKDYTIERILKEAELIDR